MEDISIIIPQNAFIDSDSDTIECYQIIEEGPTVAESDTVECVEIIEEGPCVAQTETEETAPIVEEGPTLCPVCSSQVRYFFINFTEKLLMCENGECDYPFGYEDLQLKKYGEEIDNIDMTSTQNSSVSQYTDSLKSSTASIDLEKTINVVFDDHQFLPPKSVIRKTYSKRKGSRIKKALEDLKGFNMQLHEMSEKKSVIRNQKWIQNLKTLQDRSGVVLLQPNEMNKVPVEKKNEVKLDIESGDNKTVCSIKILMATPSPSTSNVNEGL